MNTGNSNVAVDLFNAHAQYFQRLAELARQAGVQGLDRRQQVVAASLAESEEELRALLAARDLSELSSLQLEFARRRWERRQAVLQQLWQSGGAAPDSVALEMASAFKDWNQQVSGIVASAGGAAGLAGPWADYLGQFANSWPVAEAAPAQKARRK